MKRETKGAIAHIACSDVALPLMPHVAEDIEDSDARQRAEIRDLKKRLKQIGAAWAVMEKARFADTEDEMMFPTKHVQAMRDLMSEFGLRAYRITGPR